MDGFMSMRGDRLFSKHVDIGRYETGSIDWLAWSLLSACVYTVEFSKPGSESLCFTVSICALYNVSCELRQAW
jgi:hypothetical protein